jgi:pimeloyl-ACP methyl ester carboxylesterase
MLVADASLQDAGTAAKPTIVLVHGAWADASSFAPVTARLQRAGYKVCNAPNPLRGLASDAASVAAFVNQHTIGPVVLVGHSYAGSVITNAARDTPTVKALVFINAYAPDVGESVVQLTGQHPGSLLAADPSTVFDFVQYPGAGEGDVDTYVKPNLFAGIFAASLPPRQVGALAASQSPVTLSALTAESGDPAWRAIPSYFFIGTTDKVIPAATQLEMATRAQGVVETHAGDHLSMLELPRQVTKVIETAARATVADPHLRTARKPAVDDGTLIDL